MNNLSEEEKKAIEWLKKADWFSGTILNLIENQQKEIEELKKYEEGYKLLSYSLENYISKGKIKEKIKKYDKWIKEGGDYVESLEAQRYALNELLEEE